MRTLSFDHVERTVKTYMERGLIPFYKHNGSNTWRVYCMPEDYAGNDVVMALLYDLSYYQHNGFFFFRLADQDEIFCTFEEHDLSEDIIFVEPLDEAIRRNFTPSKLN